jgi:hypothetical protein
LFIFSAFDRVGAVQYPGITIWRLASPLCRSGCRRLHDLVAAGFGLAIWPLLVFRSGWSPAF